MIVDELGYLPPGARERRCSSSSSPSATRPARCCVTTNLEFSRWSEVFGDAALTAALLDRLTHHSQVLVFEGESYRFRESQARGRDLRRKT